MLARSVDLCMNENYTFRLLVISPIFSPVFVSVLNSMAVLVINFLLNSGLDSFSTLSLVFTTREQLEGRSSSFRIMGILFLSFFPVDKE